MLRSGAMAFFIGSVFAQTLPSCGSEECVEVPEPQQTVLLQQKHSLVLDSARGRFGHTVHAASCNDDSCKIWGDPHVSGFDNSEHEFPGYLALLSFGACQGAMQPVDVNMYEEGDFWLVRSAELSIQSRFARSQDFVPDKPAVGAVAISGWLLDNKLLNVQPLDMASTWDGQQLSEATIEAFTLHVSMPLGTLSIRSHKGPEGTHVLEVQLPKGVHFRAVRFPRHIDAAVTLPRGFMSTVDGLCGNRNGVAADDTEEIVTKRMNSILVSPNERLLPAQSR